MQVRYIVSNDDDKSAHPVKVSYAVNLLGADFIGKTKEMKEFTRISGNCFSKEDIEAVYETIKLEFETNKTKYGKTLEYDYFSQAVLTNSEYAYEIISEWKKAIERLIANV